MSWIPLMDYSIKNGVSLSTLRRHIKQDKVRYRVENGRYLLLDESSNAKSEPRLDSNSTAADLQKAKEEIAELKMLVALYEEKLSPYSLNS